jgi:hypothetical protein
LLDRLGHLPEPQRPRSKSPSRTRPHEGSTTTSARSL